MANQLFVVSLRLIQIVMWTSESGLRGLARSLFAMVPRGGAMILTPGPAGGAVDFRTYSCMAEIQKDFETFGDALAPCALPVESDKPCRIRPLKS